ncbi:MAG: DUF169 domain-containing protein [Pseudonocardiaceae bacterium]
MEHALLAETLSDGLRLPRPPIALAFVDTPPDGIAEFSGEVPSACTFWIRAESGVFHASAQAHHNCPVGAMTMGFEMSEALESNLMQVVGMMVGDGYIAPDEPPSIPRDERPKSGVVYGPLAQFPVRPDVILMWLLPEQAMVYNEAAGSARWVTDMPATQFGRPTCAAIPAAIEQGRPTLSLGCIGMRTFTGIPGELMLAAVPGAQADRFVDALHDTLRANREMEAFYRGQQERFAAAPS